MSILRLLNLIYGSTPVEFKSAFSLSESVARLRAATRRSVFTVLAAQAAAGPVSESRVRLQRVIPMIGNSFKPFFLGRFDVRPDGVYLTGRFTMLWFIKAFMTFWLGGVLAIGLTSFVAADRTQEGPMVLLGSLGMFGAGIALVAFGKWVSRNDVGWLSDVICTALGVPTEVQTSELPASVVLGASTERRLPTVLQITALVLLFGGLMAIWSAISGISSWRIAAGQTDIKYFESLPFRLMTGICGIFMLGIAYGVYRRHQWAWRLGLVFIGLSGLSVPFQAFMSDFPDILAIKVVICVLAVAVTVYWGCWWYAQRVHFFGASSPPPV